MSGGRKSLRKTTATGAAIVSRNRSNCSGRHTGGRWWHFVVAHAAVRGWPEMDTGMGNSAGRRAATD